MIEDGYTPNRAYESLTFGERQVSKKDKQHASLSQTIINIQRTPKQWGDKERTTQIKTIQDQPNQKSISEDRVDRLKKAKSTESMRGVFQRAALSNQGEHRVPQIYISEDRIGPQTNTIENEYTTNSGYKSLPFREKQVHKKKKQQPSSSQRAINVKRSRKHWISEECTEQIKKNQNESNQKPTAEDQIDRMRRARSMEAIEEIVREDHLSNLEKQSVQQVRNPVDRIGSQTTSNTKKEKKKKKKSLKSSRASQVPKRQKLKKRALSHRYPMTYLQRGSEDSFPFGPEGIIWKKATEEGKRAFQRAELHMKLNHWEEKKVAIETFGHTSMTQAILGKINKKKKIAITTETTYDYVAQVYKKQKWKGRWEKFYTPDSTLTKQFFKRKKGPIFPSSETLSSTQETFSSSVESS